MLARVIAVLAVLAILEGEARADGPWRGRVVDAETGAPLEGVVILAVWYVRWPSVGGWAGGGYHDSEEVVTGPDGRFEIAARALAAPDPVASVRDAEWFLLKAGYGRWRLAGSTTWPRYALEERARDAWSRVHTSGVTLELVPLRTLAERRRHLQQPPGDVPDDKMTRWLEVLNRERSALGLEPLPVRGEGRGR